MKTIKQKQTSILNTNGQAKCGKRVREENLPFPSKKNATKIISKNEIDYLGFFSTF